MSIELKQLLLSLSELQLLDMKTDILLEYSSELLKKSKAILLRSQLDLETVKVQIEVMKGNRQ